ncbi:hypothetical protein KoxyNG13_037240 [Klebsiella pasteurii]
MLRTCRGYTSPGSLRSGSPGRRIAPSPGRGRRKLRNFPVGAAAYLTGLIAFGRQRGYCAAGK